MLDEKTTKHSNLNLYSQAMGACVLVVPTSSAGALPLTNDSSHTYSSFIVKVGLTTGTISKDDFIRKYIANSDLISNHYRQSIMNFIKTVNNKDS